MNVDVILKFIAKEPVMALVTGGVFLVVVSVFSESLKIAILPGALLIIVGACWHKYFNE